MSQPRATTSVSVLAFTWSSLSKLILLCLHIVICSLVPNKYVNASGVNVAYNAI